MKHRKPFLISLILHLVELAIIFILLFGLSWYWPRYIGRGETIRYLSKEISGREFFVRRANERMRDLPFLEFMRTAIQTRSADFYDTVQAVYFSAEKYKLNPNLILAIISRESNFDPRAISFTKDGRPLAYGLMQINAGVWRPDMEQIFSIPYNVDLGCKIFKMYLDKRVGDVANALWDYWGGMLAAGSYTYPVRVLESKYYDWRPR